MNTYGNRFKITVFGGSHEEHVGVKISGLGSGIKIVSSDFEEVMHRRSFGDIPSLAFATTPRKEEDLPLFCSGIEEGITNGQTVELAFRNNNFRPQDYAPFRNHPRPSHADFAASVKYGGQSSLSGGGMFSGRMTAALVAAGVVAAKYIGYTAGFEPKVRAGISSIGGEPDKARWKDLLLDAMQDGDSLGGEVLCRIEGLPVGIGEPFFNSLESEIAHLAFSVPGVKGIFFGDFSDLPAPLRKASSLRGSQFNDLIINSKGETATNHSGGINGGLSNGNPAVFTLDIRPTASIAKPQPTFNFESGKVEELKIEGRHDVCIALRCPVIAESIALIALANLIC